MLTFKKQIRPGIFFYSAMIRSLTSTLGACAAIILLSVAGLNLYFYFLFWDWISLACTISLILLPTLIMPMIGYLRSRKMAQGKDIVYTVTDDEFTVEAGLTKSSFKREMIRSIKLYKHCLKLNLNHSITKIYLFFDDSDRKKIVEWFHKSTYKNILR